MVTNTLSFADADEFNGGGGQVQTGQHTALLTSAADQDFSGGTSCVCKISVDGLERQLFLNYPQDPGSPPNTKIVNRNKIARDTWFTLLSNFYDEETIRQLPAGTDPVPLLEQAIQANGGGAPFELFAWTGEPERLDGDSWKWDNFLVLSPRRAQAIRDGAEKAPNKPGRWCKQGSPAAEAEAGNGGGGNTGAVAKASPMAKLPPKPAPATAPPMAKLPPRPTNAQAAGGTPLSRLSRPA